MANFYDFPVKSLDGSKDLLGKLRGKVALAVNVASKCGLTPQYKGLESLWRKYKDKGLVVLGVPSNDFGGQEPGTEAQIQNFCLTNYSVSFPMTSKNAVIGGSAHPFYKWVTAEAGEAAAPRWNFHKYLIGPRGEFAGTFPSKVAPDADALTAAIEAALKG